MASACKLGIQNRHRGKHANIKRSFQGTCMLYAGAGEGKLSSRSARTGCTVGLDRKEDGKSEEAVF